jgi:hypothetical protein
MLMKHIKLFENFNKSDLEKELDKYGIKNYTINKDGTIDVDGDVNLEYKKMTKIPFKFGRVNGDFIISSNRLTSLKGCPYEVIGEFQCDENNLTSLEGMPSEIYGDFYCYNNNDLKELDSVSNIEGYIYCNDDIDMSKFSGYCKGFFIKNRYETHFRKINNL